MAPCRAFGPAAAGRIQVGMARGLLYAQKVFAKSGYIRIVRIVNACRDARRCQLEKCRLGSPVEKSFPSHKTLLLSSLFQVRPVGCAPVVPP
jgi:hypothetical protein